MALDSAARESLETLRERLLDLHQRFCFPSMEHVIEDDGHEERWLPDPSPEARDEYRTRVINAWRECSAALASAHQQTGAAAEIADVLRTINDDLRHFETSALAKLREWMSQPERIAIGKSLERSHLRLLAFLKGQGIVNPVDPEDASGASEPSELTPAVQRAWAGFLLVERELPAGATDDDAYAKLEELKGEHAFADELAKKPTWKRYVRKARKHHGKHKNTPRHGRAVSSRSIVAMDEL